MAPSPGACSIACSRTRSSQISWVSATSAGAVNAVAVAAGLSEGGKSAARAKLRSVWEAVHKAGVPDLLRLNPFLYGLSRAPRRWNSSVRTMGAPATIQRRRSRRNERTNGRICLTMTTTRMPKDTARVIPSVAEAGARKSRSSEKQELVAGWSCWSLGDAVELDAVRGS